MPKGYRPNVPLQPITFPWLNTSDGTNDNTVVLPPGIRKPVQSPGGYTGKLPVVPSIKMDRVGGTTSKGMDWKGISAKAQSVGNSVAPFISNIANAFRKPPMPKLPYLNSFTNLSKINLDDERNRVNRAVMASDVAGDRNLPSNTAAAVHSSNLAVKLNQLSSISERESNANAGIANQQAQMDMQTSFANNGKMDDYNDSLVERQVAQQREQSQNLSNASDKYVSIRNEKDKANVALQQTQMMSHAFDNSQVMGRLRWKAKLAGEKDPLGRDYKDLDGSPSGTPVFKMGGRIPMKKLC